MFKVYPSLFYLYLPLSALLAACWWWPIASQIDVSASREKNQIQKRARFRYSPNRVPQVNEQFLSQRHRGCRDSQREIAAPTIDRNDLWIALSGDVPLMGTLMQRWQIEAELLQSEGVEAITPLPHSKFLKGQRLVRLITTKPRRSFQKLLPQTYVAASFLLAIASPDEIIALPQGLRVQTHLYPETRTSHITADISQRQSEKLLQSKPTLAFVATYTHPYWRELLSCQGIPLCELETPLDTAAVRNALKVTGLHAGCEPEAELLALFIEAALQSIDNLLHHAKDQGRYHPLKNLLYISYYGRYALPTTPSLTQDLIKRLETQGHAHFSRDCKKIDSSTGSLNFEQLQLLNPSAAIIATSGALQAQVIDSLLKAHIFYSPSQIVCVDESVQQSPTQYVALAYYDLAMALLELSPEE